MAKKWKISFRWIFKLNYRRLLAIAADIGLRLYSAAILAVLIYVGYLAVTYLRGSVFSPTRIPPSLLQWQGRLEASSLREENVPGVTGSEGRAPPRHYHGVDRWFQADSRNTCTTSGCHEPLPHTKKNAKAPAFANFHATFLDCRMCHTDTHAPAGKPADAVWVNLKTGQTETSPPILELMRYMDTQSAAITADPTAAHQVITALLTKALGEIGDDPALSELLEQMQTSAPGSPYWVQAEKSLAAELPLHARGEYAAKLAPRDTGDRKTMASLTSRFQATAPDSAERKQLKETIHQGILKQPVACTACHGDQPPLLDFESLGYSAQRSAALRSNPLARTVQSIRQGQEFYIPQLLETPQ